MVVFVGDAVGVIVLVAVLIKKPDSGKNGLPFLPGVGAEVLVLVDVGVKVAVAEGVEVEVDVKVGVAEGVEVAVLVGVGDGVRVKVDVVV